MQAGRCSLSGSSRGPAPLTGHVQNLLPKRIGCLATVFVLAYRWLCVSDRRSPARDAGSLWPLGGGRPRRDPGSCCLGKAGVGIVVSSSMALVRAPVLLGGGPEVPAPWKQVKAVASLAEPPIQLIMPSELQQQINLRAQHAAPGHV